MGRLPALAAGLPTAGAVLLALGGPVSGGGSERLREPGLPGATRAMAGRAVFARMGCGGCHRFAAGGGGDRQLGPDLDRALAGYDAVSLRAKIVDPYAGAKPRYFVSMPQDFGRRMSARELDALVAFLLGTPRR